MDHAAAVGVVEAAASLRENPDRLGHVEHPFSGENFSARVAFDVLHHDVLTATLLIEPEVVNLDDVGVHESRRRKRFAAKTRYELLVVGEMFGEQLDCDLALESTVDRQQHG